MLLTPSKTDGRFPSQQGVPTINLQPDLPGSFPTDVCPDIIGQVGVMGQNSGFRRGKRGGSVGKRVWPIKGEIHRFRGGWGGQFSDWFIGLKIK